MNLVVSWAALSQVASNLLSLTSPRAKGARLT